MDVYRAQELKDFYYSELSRDIIPFRQIHGVDLKLGGYFTYLDRRGELLSEDKSAWIQGSAVWVFSTLLRELEEKKEWLISARNGVRFIREKMRRKSDGRVYPELTGKGLPLQHTADLHNEIYTALGLAAYAHASGDRKALEEARELYTLIDRLMTVVAEAADPIARIDKELSGRTQMILLCRELRRSDPKNEKTYNHKITVLTDEIFSDFVSNDYGVLLEYAGSGSTEMEGSKSRCVNIGLSFETLWILMEEAEFRKDRDLMQRIIPILERTIELGWDKECGGLYNYIDIEGRQPLQLDWDMKIWKVHCTGVPVFLLAYFLTGNTLYETWFETLQEYCWDKFPDRETGEWFGYLRRDGSVQMDLKGDRNKGFFYLPRFLLETYKILKVISH